MVRVSRVLASESKRLYLSKRVNHLMSLRAFHAAQGAHVAGDGIPLYYADLQVEYAAALNACVLLDRSHEGRLSIAGADRVEVVHRISTNDLHHLAPGEGRPTIFTNANARILDRAVAYNREAEADGEDASLLLMTGPGRNATLSDYLRRSIFFRDAAKVEDITAASAQFDLHGPTADAVIESLAPGSAALPFMHGKSQAFDGGGRGFIARREPYSGTHWTLITPAAEAETVWSKLLDAGRPHGLIPAGSLTFNTLRIRAGYPGVGRELSQEYIPLEIGLWDEVSFKKGCYTGQEIIARMESRGKLARMMVHLELTTPVDAPADLVGEDGKRVGAITSSVLAPDGQIFALGVVRAALAQPGARFGVGQSSETTATPTATISRIAGSQPAAEALLNQ